ncbi:hypothetical protein BG011_005262 [Mortierella polycephala]|uniref:Subtilisin-like protein n=1 Tax=Mortierella polycephala TaxID=41804 RepID=A0A9P6U9P3_9FUNG|nr:hypothetical protein BG011_005262 [Mortierella polycephala]
MAVDGHKYRHSQFKDPIFRSSDLIENTLQNAYWIDFHDQFEQRARFSELVKTHSGITLRHEFWDSLNAVSVSVRDESILKEILSHIEGIKLVEPVVMHDRPDVNKESIQISGKGVPKPSTVQVTILPHDLTGVRQVHESLKFFGKGIKIGIIDSGVDYNHPALGGCFGPGCKVAYGTDFVGDDGHSPDNDPMTDCDGHGTHVAGIIAANDTDFIGVAPQATLGAYRVFGCKGGTSNDVIMKALLSAAADGMQVINLSLGGPGGWRQDREARLADELAKNGILIVAAMGNEGQMGLFESSSPGVAEDSITVASIENAFKSSMYFTVDQGKLKTEPRAILYIGDADMDLANTTLVQIASGTSGIAKDDACQPINKDLKGKIALIRRGDCTFKIKITNAAIANASGVIFMDNVPSIGFAADSEGATIKVRTVTLEDGEYLLQTIKDEKKEKEGIQLIPGKGPKRVPNPSGEFLSLFSSMGPDSELNAKPDIAAPGGQIWSTFPIKLGSYASLSGTSMATPYVTGCVALFLEGLPNADHSAKAVKTALQNSARPRKQQTGFNGFASVTQQGTGLLNMMDVLLSQTRVTPSHISLNDTAHLNANHKMTITNTGETPVKYKIDIVPAAGLVPFDKYMMIEKTPQMINAKASVKVSQSTITIGPGATANVDLTFTGPSTDPLQYVIYSGYVRFTPTTVSNQSPVIHVSYMGMQGDYKKVSILDQVFGLRIFNAYGRPLYPIRRPGSSSHRGRRGGGGGHAHVGTDRHIIHGAGGIGDEVAKIDSNNKTSSGNMSPSPSANDRPHTSAEMMRIVFRMTTASGILILDLVSDQGSDPYGVKSFGVLKNGVARYVSRNDQSEGNVFQVLGWDGDLLQADGTTTSLIDGGERKNYRLRISLLKHFGNPDNDQDFESHLSEPFVLGY